MLIVAGAAITLSISNASDVVSVIGTGTLTWMLALLVLSSILGFIAKGCATIAGICLNMQLELTARIEKLLNEYDAFEEKEIDKARQFADVEPPQVSIDNVNSSFLEGLPKFLRARVERKLKLDGDTRALYRWASSCAFFQSWLVIGQSVVLLSAFTVTVFGID